MQWFYEFCGSGWRGPIMMVVFWMAIIVGVVYLVQYLKKKDTTGTPSLHQGESALEILERRYVNGELNREEYLDMKADLGKQPESE